MVTKVHKNGMREVKPPYTAEEDAWRRGMTFSGGITGRMHQHLASTPGSQAKVSYPASEETPPVDPRTQPAAGSSRAKP